MNNISQISVFDYREIEILGDLERIKLFFENLDDKELCESLENEIKNINEKLIKYMYENLEDFGKDCAIDGKFLDTYANHYSKEKCVDNRAEHDATNSCKTYYMKDGTTKKEWHYGFRAHIICDAKYGLPIKYKLTPANNSEQTELDNLLKELASNDDERYKLEKMENLMGDAGYDNGRRNKKLKEEYNINPVFDIKHIWDKDEKYKEIDDMPIAYNEDGEVFYIVDIDNHYQQIIGYLYQ